MSLGFDEPLYVLGWQPLIDWRAKKETREAAVADIARRYRELAAIFEEARLS